MKKYGGVPYDMIVLGKPASMDDVYNTGYVKASDLVQYMIKGSR